MLLGETFGGAWTESLLDNNRKPFLLVAEESLQIVSTSGHFDVLGYINSCVSSTSGSRRFLDQLPPSTAFWDHSQRHCVRPFETSNSFDSDDRRILLAKREGTCSSKRLFAIGRV